MSVDLLEKLPVPEEITSNTTTLTIDYDYLSVHLDKYNVFFHFARLVAANTDFNLTVTKKQSTQGGGISDWRAYNSGVSEDPIAAAAFLSAHALLGFLGLRRKTKNLTA